MSEISQVSSNADAPAGAGSLWKARLKRGTPPWLLKRIQQYRQLPSEARPVYLKLRCLESLGLRREAKRRASRDARSFLMICHGNIMRSPMSEALLARTLPANSGYTIRSAGVEASCGGPADPRARKVANEFMISLDQHQSQMVTDSMITGSDAVFVMDFLNQARLISRFPHAAHKIFMLASYSESGDLEIPDPVTGDEADVRRCYKILEVCIRRLAAELTRPAQNGGAHDGKPVTGVVRSGR